MQESLDMILVARDTWGGVWRRRQFLAEQFAARGVRVLFVEAPMSWPRLMAGSPDMASRPRDRRLQVVAPPIKARDNLWVTAPPKPLPNHPEPFAKVNRTLFAAHVRRCARVLDMKRPVLWINPEYAWFLTEDVAHAAAVYDITDDWTHAASLPEREAREIRDNDRRMTAAADIIFTVSHDLFHKKVNAHTSVVYMPNGVNPDMYEAGGAPAPREMDAMPRPVAGYTGTLHADRLDADLIEHVSQQGGVSQVFVGPDLLDAATRRRFQALERVFLVPAQPVERLPQFTSQFDVCHIPHLCTSFTHSLDPIKAYEYLATGRPIVSVPLRGLAHLEPFIDMAEDSDAYAELLERNVRGMEKCSAGDRRAEARRHSWSARADSILERIRDILA
jgi:glycosyltransferase involved in cell wall biosynthesis